MKARKNGITSCSGVSLVEVVAVTAIAGALAVGGASMLSSGIRMNRKVATAADRTSILQKMQTSLDCKITASNLVPSQIPTFNKCDQTLVNVYDHNGAVLVNNNQGNPTRIGDWTVRAVCRYNAALNQVLGVDIEIAQPQTGLPNPLTLNQPTQFNTDPIQTSKPYSWSVTTAQGTSYTDAMLYPTGAWPCSAELQAALGLPPVTPPNTCPAGQVVGGIQATGFPVCVDVLNFAAGEPATTTANACPAGGYAQGADQYGRVACGTPKLLVQQVTGVLPLLSSGTCWLSWSGNVLGTNYPNWGDMYAMSLLCPDTTWIASGGGVDCRTGYGANSDLNGPIPNANGWQATCCVPKGTGGTQKLTVVCIKLQ